MTAIGKYLQRYAVAEAAVSATVERRWSDAVVVPICDESADFVDGLVGAGDGGRWLLIVVVNRTEDASASVIAANTRVMVALRERAGQTTPMWSSPPMELLAFEAFDLLLVDRSSPGFALPAGQGVGHARRIGCDIALALQQRDAIDSPWIHCTDADVQLPSGYLAAAREHPAGDVALVYPFRHICPPGVEGDALALYDLSLRYYVAGLGWAGSCWAFHSVGSTMAIRGLAYAKVRGIPRRRAAEDFYLLAKVAKLGCVATPEIAPIHIRQRESKRVPFGTGVANRTIAAMLEVGVPFTLYDPVPFAMLRRFVEHWRAADLTQVVQGLPETQAAALTAGMARVGAVTALAQARVQVTSALALSRRTGEWFDAFRTLAFLHAARDHGLPKRPWREALAAAPFEVEGAAETLERFKRAP